MNDDYLTTETFKSTLSGMSKNYYNSMSSCNVSSQSNNVSISPTAYSTYSTMSWCDIINEDDKKEIVTKLLENEDELMPILKKYLVGYLDKIMDNPDQIVDKLIKEKDTEIESLKKKVEELENKVELLLQQKYNPPYTTPYPYTPYPGYGDIIYGFGSSNTTASTTV